VPRKTTCEKERPSGIGQKEYLKVTIRQVIQRDSEIRSEWRKDTDLGKACRGSNHLRDEAEK